MDDRTENRTSIFSSVISRLLESCVPYISFVLSEFEKENQIFERDDTTSTTDETIQTNNHYFVDQKLEDLFEKFPRKIPFYKDLIVQLTAMAGSNVTETIHFLTKMIKDIVNGTLSSSQLIQSIQNFSPFFDSSIRHHALFLYYFGLFFVSDLICQIVATYSTNNFNNLVDDNDDQKNSKTYYGKKFDNLDNSISFLTKAGYNIATSEPKLQKATETILKQWSVIFSILSEKNFPDLSEVFQSFDLSKNFTSPLCLLRYVRLDLSSSFSSDFFETVLSSAKSHFKKKNLTNEALESMSCMISTLPYNNDLFQKIYSFGKSVCKEKRTWSGGILLTSAVIQYMPNKVNQLSHFLQKKVLAYADNKSKLPTVLQCFELFIMNKNRDPDLEIWEWGPHARPVKATSSSPYNFTEKQGNTDMSFRYVNSGSGPSSSEMESTPNPSLESPTNRSDALESHFDNSIPIPISPSREILDKSRKQTNRYEFIKIHSSLPEKSFMTLFMDSFYEKSDFSVCPSLFKKVLLHLASLDFQLFLATFVQKAIALDFNDPRFITLLMLVPLINSDNFKKNSYVVVPEMGIKSFNDLLKPYILKAINVCKEQMMSQKVQHGICVNEYDIMIDSLMNEADQKIAQTLYEWDTISFEQSIDELTRSHQSKTNFDLLGRLMPALKYVIGSEQIHDPIFVGMLIEFASSENDYVSSTAFHICKEIIPLYANIKEYLTNLMIAAAVDNSESIYVSLLLINHVINSIDPTTIEYDTGKRESYLLRNASSFQLNSNKVQLPINESNEKLTESFLHDLEAIIFLCEASAFPEIRHLAYLILRKMNNLLRNRGILNFCQNQIPLIEKKAKTKILLRKIPKELQLNHSPPTKILFETVLISHYYDIWLFYIAEIMNVLIQANYTPLFCRIALLRPSFLQYLNSIKQISISNTGLLLFFLDEMFYKRSLLNAAKQTISDERISSSDQVITEKNQNSKKKEELIDYRNFHSGLVTPIIASSIFDVDLSCQYEPFDENDMKDQRKDVCNIMNKILSSDNIVTGLSLLPHLHFSLLAPMIDVLASLPNEYLFEATHVLSIFFRLPEIHNRFFIHNFKRITNFLNALHFTLLKNGLNTPRSIDWDEDMQNQLEIVMPNLLNYCIIIMMTFLACKDGISDDEWSMNSRSIVFRFLINWAITTKESLQMLRSFSEIALSSLSKIGTLFIDSLFIDDKAIDLFSKMETRGILILKNLLFNQYEILLGVYIKACYTQSSVEGDLYFNSLVELFKFFKEENCSKQKHQDRNDILTYYIGDLILLAQVYYHKENPRALELIEYYVQISDLITDVERAKENANDPKLIPSILPFATEAVIHSFFKLANILKTIKIPFKCIVEGVRPWMSQIRLLPTQQCCSNLVLPQFHYYTPYKFVEKMIKLTDPNDDDEFRQMTTLWIDLAKSPDNINIIPLFILSHKDVKLTTSIVKMIGVLFNSYPERCIENIIPRCSFAFYYYTTKCLNINFDFERKWLTQLLINTVHRNWTQMLVYAPIIFHYAFLFRNTTAAFLFDILCNEMSIEYSGTNLEMSNDIFVDTVRQFCSKLDDEAVIEWGNEALKWFFGSEDIDLALTSLRIYNLIRKPFDPSIVFSLIKTISYHLENSQSNLVKLVKLTKESFQIFDIYEEYIDSNESDKMNVVYVAFKYASSFLDCRVFVESDFIINSLNVYIRSLKYPDLIQTIFANIVSLVRPMILVIETNSNAQKLIDFAISKTKMEEFYMIAAPVKRTFPQLFPSCPPIHQFISKVDDNAKSAALVHYSMMATNASVSVLNNIFEISDYILNTLKLMVNNRIPLAKLYHYALRSLNKCSYAMDFVRSICEKDPAIGVIDIIDVYEWDRSISDVNRSIQLLIHEINEKQKEKDDNNVVVSITDFHSYTSTQNVLFSKCIPKVIPFSTQADIIEGMKNVQIKKRKSSAFVSIDGPHLKKHHTLQSFSAMKKNKKRLGESGMIPDSVSLVFTETKVDMGQIGPLMHPTKLIMKPLS